MNFQEAQEQYGRLTEALQSRQISREEFHEKIDNLRVQDEDGHWWQIRAEDGEWMKWDGNAWRVPPRQNQPATSSRQPVSSHQTVSSQQSASSQYPANEQKVPETTWQLVKMILRGLPKMLLRSLPKTILMMAVIYLVHTYLVVGPNEGFNSGTNWFLDNMLVLGGHILSGVLFWMLVPMVTMAIIRGSKSAGGFSNYIRQVQDTLVSVFSPLTTPGHSGLILSISGIAIAGILSVFWRDSLVSLQFFMMTLFSLITISAGSFMYLLARAVQSDTSKIFKRHDQAVAVSVQQATWFFGGVAIGMLITTIPYVENYGIFIGGAAAIIAFVLHQNRGNQNTMGNQANFWLLAFITIGFWLLKSELAYADDGGADECDGFWNVVQLRCEGAVIAMGIGFVAAIAAGAGLLISNVINGLFPLQVPGWFTDPADQPGNGAWPEESPGPEVPPDSETPFEEDPGIYGDPDPDPTDQQPLEEKPEEPPEPVSPFEEDPGIYGDPDPDPADQQPEEEEPGEEKEEPEKQEEEPEEEKEENETEPIDIEILKSGFGEKGITDEIKNAMAEPPKNPGMLEKLTDRVTGLFGLLGVNEVQGLIEEGLEPLNTAPHFDPNASKAYKEFVANNPNIRTDGTNIYNKNGTVNHEGTNLLNGVRNSSVAKQILSGLQKGLDAVNYITNITDNWLPVCTDEGRYIEGDGWTYGTVKGVVNTYGITKIGTANPGLGVMELVNWAVTGGSKASGFISPTKTITGMANFTSDLIRDKVSGTNDLGDLAKSGKYGPTMKSLYETGEIVGETYKDGFSKFSGEFSEMVKNEKMWEGMRNSSHEIWKPQPDAGFIRSGFCKVGELGTNGVIGIAETTSKVTTTISSEAGKLAGGDFSTVTGLAGKAADTIKGFFPKSWF